MSIDSVSRDLEQVCRTPASAEQIRDFQAWEKLNAASMYSRYRDLPVEAVFGLRPSDVVTVSESMALRFEGNEVLLFDVNKECIGKIADVPVDLLRVFLTRLDGRRSIEAIVSEPPFVQVSHLLKALVGGFLGSLFLVSATMNELEAQLTAIELLRFPVQSPYAMPRQYWENSIAVRSALDLFYRSLDDVREFSECLRGLHRLATTGIGGENYYGGAGGIGTVPGEYRQTPLENHFSARKKWIIAEWVRILGCRAQLMERGIIVSAGNTPLLQIADDGRKCLHIYGQRGEYLALQVNEIRTQLIDLRAYVAAGDCGKVLRHCALFHHAFALAHPFNNINNSIAMNIVNDLLRKVGLGILPHLYFDQIAYFMRPEDYVEFFEIAFQAHVMSSELGYDRTTTTELLEAVQR